MIMTDKDILDLYEAGEVRSARGLARLMGMSHQWGATKLGRLLADAGYPPLMPRGQKRPIDKERLNSLVHEQHIPLSRRDVYGVSAATVLRWLDEYGLRRPIAWETRRRVSPVGTSV